MNLMKILDKNPLINNCINYDDLFSVITRFIMQVRPWASVVLLTAALVQADVVRVLSKYGYDQPVTSTILNWIPIQKDNPVPKHAVIGALSHHEEDINNAAAPNEKDGQSVYICRLRVEGVWVSGGAMNGECIASAHGQTHRSKIYEILENTEGGARLSWVKWDKYERIDPGTVFGDGENYIARRGAGSDIYSHLIGRLEPYNGLGKVIVVQEDGSLGDFGDGEVLKETEPTRYELGKIKFNQYKKRVVENPMILGVATLENKDAAENNKPTRVDAAIGYRLVI